MDPFWKKLNKINGHKELKKNSSTQLVKEGRVKTGIGEEMQVESGNKMKYNKEKEINKKKNKNKSKCSKLSEFIKSYLLRIKLIDEVNDGYEHDVNALLAAYTP